MVLFILYVSSKILNKKINILNLVINSALSSLVLIIGIMKNYTLFLNSFFNVIIVISLNVLFYFKPKKIIELFKIVIIVNLVSFLIGGLSLGLYFVNFKSIFISSNLIVLVITTILVYILIKYSLDNLGEFVIKKKMEYITKIYYNGNSVEFTSFLDSGNSLIDPTTKKKAIVVEFQTVKKLLDKEVINFLEGEEPILDFYDNVKINNIASYKIISFKSLGNKKSFILAFTPTKVEIIIENKANTYENLVIGITTLTFDGESYNGLLNGNII